MKIRKRKESTRGHLPKIEGGTEMRKTIRARVFKGMIEPLEKVDIREGEEIVISISKAPSKGPKKSFSDALKKTAGARKDLVDCDELIKNIYNDRLIMTRPEVKLRVCREKRMSSCR